MREEVDGKIIATFGDLVVTDLGIECTHYFISTARLKKSDWVHHVCQKTWVNSSDFKNAFNKALNVHNVVSPQKDNY
tara:strand:- start:223 stop:453 length:231 start_codon:yes stop_codon:yes gene_type:complete